MIKDKFLEANFRTCLGKLSFCRQIFELLGLSPEVNDGANCYIKCTVCLPAVFGCDAQDLKQIIINADGIIKGIAIDLRKLRISYVIAHHLVNMLKPAKCSLHTGPGGFRIRRNSGNVGERAHHNAVAAVGGFHPWTEQHSDTESRYDCSG